MVVVDASSLRSSNANTSTLLSFESSSDRKLGAWFVTLVVVPTVEKKVVVFIFFRKKNSYIILVKQKSHVTSHMICLHGRLITT